MSATDKTHQQIVDSNQPHGIKKGRDALAKVSVAASTDYPEKEPIMNNVTNFPQPPVGFKLEYVCSCGMGCTPNDLNADENCQILGSSYEGPGVHLSSSSGCQVNSRWTAERGVFFDISNYGYASDADDAKYIEKPWTREQLEHLPKMVEQVLSKIDQAHAVKVMTANPVPRKDPRWHTVTELAVWCDTHDIDAVTGFAAFDELHGAEYRVNGGSENA